MRYSRSKLSISIAARRQRTPPLGPPRRRDSRKRQRPLPAAQDTARSGERRSASRCAMKDGPLADRSTSAGRGPGKHAPSASSTSSAATCGTWASSSRRRASTAAAWSPPLRIARRVAQHQVHRVERRRGLLGQQAGQIGEVALCALLDALAVRARVPDRRADVDRHQHQPERDQDAAKRDAGEDGARTLLLHARRLSAAGRSARRPRRAARRASPVWRAPAPRRPHALPRRCSPAPNRNGPTRR